MIIPSAFAGGILFLKSKIILEKSKISIDNSEMAWYNVITTREQQTGGKKMTAAEKYTLKQRNLKTEFAEQYSLWREAGYVDDRAIFCNIYEIYLESCEDMKAVENIHIQCAVNARLSDDIQTLRKIYSRFQ